MKYLFIELSQVVEVLDCLRCLLNLGAGARPASRLSSLLFSPEAPAAAPVRLPPHLRLRGCLPAGGPAPPLTEGGVHRGASGETAESPSDQFVQVEMIHQIN